jgi:hypothetical protein
MTITFLGFSYSIREKMTMVACHETDVDVNENAIEKSPYIKDISTSLQH